MTFEQILPLMKADSNRKFARPGWWDSPTKLDYYICVCNNKLVQISTRFNEETLSIHTEELLADDWEEIITEPRKKKQMFPQKYPVNDRYMNIHSSFLLGITHSDWTKDERDVISDTLHDYMQGILFPALDELCEGMKVDIDSLPVRGKGSILDGGYV